MILFLLIALLSALLQFFLPWWTMMVAAAVLSFFLGKNFRHAFFAGSLACGMAWLIYELLITFIEGSLMTDRIAALFSLPASSLLCGISFLIAAIGGGLGAWLGYSLKKINSFSTQTRL
ncbi:MAG TPA: hypothetical protein PLD84_06535 [Chitinophagales bacterium]|nr:hypothetical protein [Chitinophagales bacterium]